jgi:hypothetical protein
MGVDHILTYEPGGHLRRTTLQPAGPLDGASPLWNKGIIACTTYTRGEPHASIADL